MTYRRLSFWLCSGSTLALAFVWWWSLQSWHEFGGSMHRIAFTGFLKSGTLGISFTARGAPVNTVYSMRYPTSRVSQATRDQMGWKGTFRMENTPAGGTPATDIHHLAAPLWFLWAVVNGSALVTLQYLDHRSRNAGRRITSSRTPKPTDSPDAP